MLFDALFLGLKLGVEKAEESIAASQVAEWRNDEELQRREFFDKMRKQREDLFMILGEDGDSRGKEFAWNDLLPLLDLIDEGYWPFAMSLKYPIDDEEVKRYYMERSQFKVIQNAHLPDRASVYLKLTDVEAYILYRNRSGSHYRPSQYEDYSLELRNLMYKGKITIGIPFPQEGFCPCHSMTTSEARAFMNETMERRFQQYWKEYKDWAKANHK